MTAALIAGLITGYAIALPVGAVATYIVGLTARTSLRVGTAAALGVATTDGLYASLAMIGGSALAGVLAPAIGPLRAVSAAVLLGIGAWTTISAFRTHRAATAGAGAPPSDPGATVAYLRLLAMTAMNPATVVYFVAVVVANPATAHAGTAERVVFVAAAFAASASWQVVLAGGGALLGRALTGPRGRLVTSVSSGAIMAGLAVSLLLAA
jgi:arginine exporter protein ArgO